MSEYATGLHKPLENNPRKIIKAYTTTSLLIKITLSQPQLLEGIFEQDLCSPVLKETALLVNLNPLSRSGAIFVNVDKRYPAYNTQHVIRTEVRTTVKSTVTSGIYKPQSCS